MTAWAEGGCSCGEIRYRLTGSRWSCTAATASTASVRPAARSSVNALIEATEWSSWRASRGGSTLLATTAASMTDPPLSDLRDGLGQRGRAHRPSGSSASARSKRSVAGFARRAHLHAVEADTGSAYRIGAGVRGLLRPERCVAVREPRPHRGSRPVLNRRLVARAGYLLCREPVVVEAKQLDHFLHVLLVRDLVRRRSFAIREHGVRLDPPVLAQLAPEPLRESEMGSVVAVQVPDLLAAHAERELAPRPRPCLDARPGDDDRGDLCSWAVCRLRRASLGSGSAPFVPMYKFK